MYERILLPTDGSAGMSAVVDHAAELAAVHGASINALYVVDTASFTSLPMETSWEGISDLLREEGEEALRAVEQRVGGDIEVTTTLTDGSPSREIVDRARESECDVVVMGTHGRGGIDRLLLGSVAERVVRSADVPVLTVRVDEDATTDDARPASEPEPN